ncbi:SusC/RagA family TonB-linked outer membrane protein [Chitinophaga sp. 212800010-3]|uniref:SusC/RagA family TonB-linked outer membrane protein n=1 Tax=unclassified Chitinophaga TaxID=2619133 RepID=UPI002DF37EDE|nr:SusC/RagA family TonB-linked outer membrane protein [Chitinophaga sp. 212800010-3]
MKKLLGFSSTRKMLQGFAMRLSGLFFLLLIVSAVTAQNREVLNKQVSYHAEKLPLLKVLKEIHALTDVRFTYNADIVRKQPAVTVSVKAATLGELLRQVLVNTNLAFDVDMGGIVIYPASGYPQTDNTVALQVFGQVVVNGKAEPLQGATIQVMSTNIGTVTAKDGMFSLLAKENDQLRISQLGMKTVIYTVKRHDGNAIIIKMDTVPQAIQEVVVNGYQKIDAKMATAAIFKLSGERAIEPGMASIDQMLQGKVPGLMLINTSGGVNARPTIRMRGTSTFVGNASPLWVIDNVVRPDPVDISATQLNTAITDGQNGNYSLIGSAVSGLNPYDIESITFLKDAAATAIYGTRAANGVIVVTTKKGKAGPMRLSYNTDLSFQQRPSYNNLHLMNSLQRVTLSRQLVEDGTIFNGNYNGFRENISYEGLVQALYARRISEPEFRTAVAKLETNNVDWFKVLFRNAFSMTHSVNMSGGAGKTTYYGSVSYSDNWGAAQKDGQKRYTADLSVHNETTSRLSVDFQLMGNYSKTMGYHPSISPLSYALKTNRAIPSDAFYPKSLSNALGGLPIPPPLTFNMLNDINQTENNASTRSVMASLILNYRLGKGLVLRNTSSAVMDAADQMSAAYDKSFYVTGIRNWNIDFLPTDGQLALSRLPYGGMATLSNMNSLSVETRTDITYNKDFFKGRDQFILTAGNVISSQQIKGVESTQPGYFPDRGQQFFANATSKSLLSKYQLTDKVNNVVSMYGSAIYSMNNKYVLTGTIRTDGSNRFGQYSNAKFLPNYGLSGKWVIGNEPWLQKSRFVTGLDLRASFGTQGNVVQAVGPELIASYDRSDQPDPVTGVPFLGIKSLPYPELRWEKTYQWNFGTDFALFDKRVEVNLDYYLKKSVDLLTNKPIAYEYGMDMMYENAGVAYNSGLELVLNVVALQRKNTRLSFRFMNFWNKNEVSKTYSRNDYMAYLNGTALIPGRARTSFYSYSYKGLNPENGLPMFNNVDAKVTTNDPANILVYSGQLYPKLNGSFSTEFSYKNFSISGDFFYALGGHKRLNPMFNMSASGSGVPNPFENVNRDLAQRWRKPGDEKTTNIPSIRDNNEADKIHLPISDIENMVSFSPVVIPYEAYDMSSLRVVDGSFLRCKNVRLNYSVPAAFVSRAGIRGLRLGCFVRNPFTIASKALQGQDPEIDGVGTTALPVTRQYGLSIGVNL